MDFPHFCYSVSFLWQLNLFFIIICASNIHGVDLSRKAYESLFAANGTIILENFNKVPDGLPDVKTCIMSRFFANNKTLSFELYPDFTFNTEYFDDILNNAHFLKISIRFNNELKKLVCSKEVKSNEYANRFLENFLQMEHLKYLKISSLGLTEVSEMICEFCNFEELYVEYKDLDNLQLNWNRLLNLKSLKIGYSETITKLNESIFNLPSLRTLTIKNCGITVISSAINKLEHLYILEISSTPIISFPREIPNLKKLEYFTITDSALEELVINMQCHPKLTYVDLCNNFSLKCLKLLNLEIPKELNYFDLTGCPLKDVEIWLNLRVPGFDTFNRENQLLESADYIIKVNPSELFSFTKITRLSESKIYRFDIVMDNESNKNIIIKELILERTIPIDESDLVSKWTDICKKVHLESNVELVDELNHSVKFLKSLYSIKSNGYSDWTGYFPFEYKEKMIAILSDLFERLSKNNSEYKVRSILKIFKRPHSEQLIYFNFLLKYSESCLRGNECFIAFIKESIEVLKELAFITFLNLEKYESGKSLRRSIKNYSYEKDFENGYLKSNKPFHELLNAIINAKRNFDSKVTVDFCSNIIGDVAALINDQELFNYDKIVESLLENWEMRSECFEYQVQANANIIKRLNTNGMKILITSIMNNQIFVN